MNNVKFTVRDQGGQTRVWLLKAGWNQKYASKKGGLRYTHHAYTMKDKEFNDGSDVYDYHETNDLLTLVVCQETCEAKRSTEDSSNKNSFS